MQRRIKLIKARAKMYWTLEEAAEHLAIDPNTLSRWERGRADPRAYNIQRLCEVYGATAKDLDVEKESMAETEAETETVSLSPLLLPIWQSEAIDVDDTIAALLTQDLTVRLLKIVWTWPRRNTRYGELQGLIMRETEDYDTMAFHSNDPFSRRDALRHLALLPLELCGLSILGTVLAQPTEEILTQCAAGITACWYLRKGKDLVFVSDAVARYIPTLKGMTTTGPALQRKTAADLLVQCLLLKSTLAWNLSTTTDALRYAQQAEEYNAVAENPLLHILAVRTLATAYRLVNRWELALQAGEKAQFLLESGGGTPIPHLVQSYVYVGLATYQSYNGQKEAALSSLRKADETFFTQSADEIVPIWVDYSIGGLLGNRGLTYVHLGSYKEAVDSFAQIQGKYANDTTIPTSSRITRLIEQVVVEASRDDKARDMEQCIDLWKQGIEGAKMLQANQKFNEAVVAHATMSAAWPGEKRIKELRDLIVHW